jgi:multiple sugar transport system ATP-binding protein
VTVDDGHREQLAGHVGKEVALGVRAENIEVSRDEGITADQLRGKVLVVEPLGSHDLLTVRLGPELIKVSTRPDMNVQADEDIGMRLEHEYLSWLDAETGRTIGM